MVCVGLLSQILLFMPNGVYQKKTGFLIKIILNRVE